MALPQLTPEQRNDALAKAAIARKNRAELKGELKSGKFSLAAGAEARRRTSSAR